jgi:hypothetical protein
MDVLLVCASQGLRELSVGGFQVESTLCDLKGTNHRVFGAERSCQLRDERGLITNDTDPLAGDGHDSARLAGPRRSSNLVGGR